MKSGTGTTRQACFTEGCSKVAAHKRTFTVAGGWGGGGGEIETTSWFCCEHVDMLDAEHVPVLDVRVVGRVRR